MNDALIYAEGFFGILKADDEVEPTGKPHPETVKGEFELKNVDFTYSNGTQALWDVSMRIEAGKITALVGLSGAGKSTIVNLLDKFYQPQQGVITLDGVPLSEWDTEWLRENVGLVLQKNHIFDGSIEENIKYGCPQATHEDVVKAAKQAYIYDQIMGLPHGFKTEALQLSGGQQQRIAIARMFIKNPPIIFLDEPTASLDAIATEQIKASIDAIKKGRRTDHRCRPDLRATTRARGTVGCAVGGVSAGRTLQGDLRRQCTEYERRQDCRNDEFRVKGEKNLTQGWVRLKMG